MRPVELSEPGGDEHQIETEEFDVQEALSNLSDTKEATTADKEASGEHNENPSVAQEESSEGSSDATGILSRLKSLF